MSTMELVKAVGISEIFSSLQGEGPHIGESHIFVRFEDCNIHCAYCDELGKPAVHMELGDVLGRVLELEKKEGLHSYVSLTGGEPLLYVNFLDPLIDKLKQEGFKIYLETSGIFPKALERVVDRTDVVAMDIKLKSITKEPRNYFEEHKEFLRISRRAGEVFVKMVVSPEIDMDEFLTGVRLIESENPAVLLVLQGVTTKGDLSFPRKRESKTLDPRFRRADRAVPDDQAADRRSVNRRGDDIHLVLRELQKVAFQFLPNVRIIPRLHIAMGIR